MWANSGGFEKGVSMVNCGGIVTMGEVGVGIGQTLM